jgi:hypothetical protein
MLHKRETYMDASTMGHGHYGKINSVHVFLIWWLVYWHHYLCQLLVQKWEDILVSRVSLCTHHLALRICLKDTLSDKLWMFSQETICFWKRYSAAWPLHVEDDSDHNVLAAASTILGSWGTNNLIATVVQHWCWAYMGSYDENYVNECCFP